MRTCLFSTSLLLLCVLCLPLRYAEAGAHFLRGDANHDKAVDISDAVFILTYLFSGGPAPLCQDATDSDDNGSLEITDPIRILTFLFLGGDPPALPYPRFEADPTEDALNCLGDDDPEVLTGDITTNLTLTSDKTYKLVSGVFVREGGVLNIQAGTTIMGDTATEGLLVIDRGGRINAIGTPTHPVVFTSDKPVGSRGAGDWGGLILLGRGDNNTASKEALAEGLQGELWGGGDNIIPDDNSGRLSYVRVEFGGTEISPNNEVNSISLFGVGSATQIDHIQVKNNLDDGFEWFGGNCDLKYGLATAIQDDCFDYSFGWTGRGQFWLAQQDGTGERGFEVDNHEDVFDSVPLTNPLISNVTVIGDPREGDVSRSDAGLMLRRGCGSRIYNSIVVGFKDAGLDIDDAATTNNNPADGTLVVDFTIFHDNNEPAETGDADETDPEAGFNYTSDAFLRTLNTSNVIASDPPIVDPYNTTSPNFRPQNDALTAGFDLTTLDAFFEPTSYRGAVSPLGPDWTQESWISYLPN